MTKDESAAPKVDPISLSGVRKAHERKPDLLDVNEQLVAARHRSR